MISQVVLVLVITSGLGGGAAVVEANADSVVVLDVSTSKGTKAGEQ